ncbi:hypothetical protein WN59_09735 [Salinicoccus sediminis]|uniref:DUF218 domain-containing protein n=1 Tax=Salinicoccus sediminis TaxID=1432562 RepID=A0A0M2SGQ1_9STAP|nr:YdcF family protein [Salinicoccus sediminis]KKK33884.1 hypothetical protein WN59_09735 [Salinicoccus sediminis]
MNLKFIMTLGSLLTVFAATILADSFLPVEAEEPRESDVIVVLGGGDQGRVKQAAGLYEEGYADEVLITASEKDGSTSGLKTVAEHYGIPEEALIVENDATSTYTNAVSTMDFMEEEGIDSAVVVTSDYHVERAEFIFDKVNDAGYDLNYIAAPNLEGENWIERENSHVIWFSEMTKMWGYRMGLYKWIDQ